MSTNATRLETRKGECEVCANSGVITVIKSAGNIWMCQQHWNEEQLTISAQATINTSRHIDSGVTVRHDVFVSAATPIIELKGAIQNDSNIPDAEKNYALVKEIEARIKSLTKAIFDDEEALKEKKAQKMALIANGQNLVATLRADLRSQFGHLNVSMPVTTKTVKPSKSPISNKGKSTPSTTTKQKKSFTRADLADLNEIADKYGVSNFTLRSILESSDMTMEQGGAELRKLMGLPPLV